MLQMLPMQLVLNAINTAKFPVSQAGLEMFVEDAADQTVIRHILAGLYSISNTTWTGSFK